MTIALPLVVYDELEQQVEAMERDGFVYFPNLLSPDEVAELRRLSVQLEPSAEALDTDLTLERDGHFQRCINAAFNRDPLFLKYLDKPGLIELAEAVHGADCHIVSMHTWAVGPGRPDQLLHTDWLPITLPEDIATESSRQNPDLHHYRSLLPERHVSGIGPNQLCDGQPSSGSFARQ